MKHRLAVIGLLLTAVVLPGCGSITQRASAGMTPMVEGFPFQAPRPVARELRYTFMSLIVLDGKEHKRTIAADDVTRAQGKVAPGAVFASATAPARRVSDDITRRAQDLQKRGADGRTVAAMHSQAASTAATEAALGRAQAGVGAMSAFMNFTAVLAQSGQWLTDAWAARLGEWVRRNTGTVGPAAPEGSVLQVDFLFMSTGKAYGVDSRSDFVVHATLLDRGGRKISGRAGYEMYTYMGQSTIAIPPDAVVVQPGIVSAEKQPVLKDVVGDPYSPPLAVAASAALADLYRQLGAR